MSAQPRFIEDDLADQAVKARRSFVYFLWFVRVEDPFRGIIRWRRWLHLLRLARQLERGESLVILKARQLGVTWLIAAYIVWYGMTHPHATILVVSMGQREANELVRRALFIHDQLPWWCKEKIVRWATPSIGMSYIEWAHRSRILSLPSTPNAGRSFTANVVIADEAAMHQYAEQNWAAYRPTLDGGGQVVMVSTSAGPAGLFHERYQAAKRGLGSLKHVFVPWWARPSRRLRVVSRDGAVTDEPSQEWLEAMRADFSGTIADFYREFPANEKDAWTVRSGVVYGMRDDGTLIFSEESWPQGNLWPVQKQSTGEMRRDPCLWQECIRWYAGVDWGGGRGHATAVDIYGVTQAGRLHQFAEYHYPGAVGTDEIALFLRSWQDLIPSKRFTSIECGIDESNSIETLRRSGFPEAQGALVDRKDGFGICTMQLTKRLITHNPDTCPASVAEYNTYYWQPSRHPVTKETYETKGTVDHDGDHKDVMRYIALREFGPGTPAEVVERYISIVA